MEDGEVFLVTPVTWPGSAAAATKAEQINIFSLILFKYDLDSIKIYPNNLDG